MKSSSANRQGARERLRISSTAGLIISRGWMSVCAFGALLVIGRSLTPSEFGVFALASSIALLPQLLTAAGFYERILTEPDTPENWRSAYWCSAASGLAGTLFVLVVATIWGLTSNDSAVPLLLLPLSLTPLLWGLAAIHEAALVRNGCGGRIAAVLTAAETVSLVTLLVALEFGLGSAALVASRIANGIVTLAGYWQASARSPFGSIDRGKIRGWIGFSSDVVASRLVSWLEGYGTDVLNALTMPAAGLGIFRMGVRIYSAAAAVLLHAPGIAQTAAAGAGMKFGSGRARAVTLRFAVLQAALVLPLFFGLAASADAVLRCLFSPQWADASTVLAIVCLTAPAVLLINTVSAILLAEGRSRSLLKYSAAVTLFPAAALLAGSYWGPAGAAGARAIVFIGLAIVVLTLVLKADPFRKSSAFRSLRTVIGTCLVQSIVVALVLATLGSEGSTLVQLANIVSANTLGVTVYAIGLRILAKPTFKVLQHMMLANFASIRRARPALQWRTKAAS